MKAKKLIIIMGTVIVAGGAYFFFPLGKATAPEEQPSTSVSPLTFTESLCTLQPNRAYICKAEALGDFKPRTIKDTGSGNLCTVSYDSKKGFVYSSKTKTITVSPGDMAVELLPAQGIINLARSAEASINIRLVPKGVIDFVMVVDKNYAVERCLVLQ